MFIYIYNPFYMPIANAKETITIYIYCSHKMLISSIMKLLLVFLVLLQLIFCSSAGWVFRSVKPVELPEVAPESNLAHEATISTHSPQYKDPFDTKPETTFDHPQTYINISDQSVSKALAKAYGERLAAKVFGPGGKKGFRWGYKVGKRIHSVAKRCEKVMDALDTASCPKPTSVLPNSEIVNCVVEVDNFDGLNGTCSQTYESSQVPPEATCNLDEPSTLDPDNCVKN